MSLIKSEFLKHKGFLYTKENISILTQFLTVTKENIKLTDEQKASVSNIVIDYLIKVGNLKQYSQTDKKILIKDYFNRYTPFNQTKTIGLETTDYYELDATHKIHVRIDRLASAEEGVYEVSLSLTDDTGCADSIRRKIPVSRELMPPNVFTPNGDGLNDYFEVSTQGDHLYNLRIFTRTGTQVHVSQSSRIVWDGRTLGGSEVPEGIYYYLIESSDTPVETEVSGFIHLYR